MILSKSDISHYTKRLRRLFNSYKGKTNVIFIFGTQRSGTNMLSNLIGGDYNVDLYNEDNPRAFDHFRIRPIQILHRIVRNSNAKYVLFKPNLDLQTSHILIHEFPGSIGFWIFRNYWDVVNSSSKKWYRGQLAKIKYLAERDLDGDRWYTERIDKATKETISELYHKEMNEETAGALKWYLRNQFFYQNKLCNSDRLYLIDYNTIVDNPNLFSKFLFSKTGISLDVEMLSNVHSISKNKGIEIKDKIDLNVENICDELLTKLKKSCINFHEDTDN